MNNFRISTTISPKHAAILKKHAKVHGTQQKVLELALETFDKNALPDSSISPEELFVTHSWKEKLSIVMYKEQFAALIKSADLKQNEEWFNANKMYMAFAVEFFLQRPVTEMNLQELLEGSCSLARLSNLFTRILFSDDGDHYTIKIYHEYGINGTGYLLIPYENLFNYCGLKYKKSVSDRTVFLKIYKDEPIRQGIMPVPKSS